MGSLFVLVLSAFAFGAEAPASKPDLPTRLVIAMDGVSYFDVARLQSEEARCFTSFQPVARSISTYPSLSDISWADIFRTAPPSGYQRYHFSVGKNRIVGGALSDMGNALEYEKRMHVFFHKFTQHAASYVFPLKMAKKEAREIAKKFFEARGIPTFYAYMLTTDTMQHTDGDIDKLLCYVDRQLTEVQARYRELMGHDLEIVLVSDHGNNHANQGKLAPIRKELKKAGYEIADKIAGPKDVAFTTAGILTSVAVFMQPAELVGVADVLVRTRGIDLVTYIDPANPEAIVIRGEKGMARVIRAEDGRYGYQVEAGDPIGYLPVLEGMRAEGLADSAGFATGEAWLEATAAHEYPAAPERVYRGHKVVTMNTAPLIASLKDGYESTYGFVKLMSRVHKRGGTHGALSARSSTGIAMTNFRALPSLTTNRVASTIGWDAMNPYKEKEGGARLVDSRLIAYDLDQKIFVESEGNLGPEHSVFVNLWEPQFPGWRELGVKTVFKTTVEWKGKGKNRRLGEMLFEAATVPHTEDFSEFRIPLGIVLPRGIRLQTGKYRIAVSVQRLDEATGKLLGLEKLTDLSFFTDSDGEVVAY